MLRNKRLAIEQTRMVYMVELLNGLDAEVLQVAVPALGVVLHLDRQYPFSAPTVTVNGVRAQKTFVQQYNALAGVRQKYDIDMPCMCCSRVRTRWVPTYGMREVLDDYVETSTRLHQYLGYAAILDALPFDDGVHACILHFL